MTDFEHFNDGFRFFAKYLALERSFFFSLPSLGIVVHTDILLFLYFGYFTSIFLATRGQFERVVPFWSPTEYSLAKKDYLRSQITIFNAILDDIPSNLL